MNHFAAVPYARASTSGAATTFDLITMEAGTASPDSEPLTADGYVSPDSRSYAAFVPHFTPARQTGSTPCPPPCK